MSQLLRCCFETSFIFFTVLSFDRPTFVSKRDFECDAQRVCKTEMSLKTFQEITSKQGGNVKAASYQPQTSSIISELTVIFYRQFD